MNVRLPSLLGIILAALQAAVAMAEETVEIVRDRWGVPHVFAESEEALFYGAGYAMAEDRLLQMLLLRSEAEGRLAEVLGPDLEKEADDPGPRDPEYLAFLDPDALDRNRFVRSDLTWRLLGFDRHARKLLENLQPDTRRNLEAFAAGVNEFASQHPERLSLVDHPFPEKPRPWIAADCMTLWARHAYLFTGGWEGEVQNLREYERWLETHQDGESFPAPEFKRDDSAAIVTEEEFQRSNPQVYERLKNLKAASEMSWFASPEEGLKASHNWVVSGARSTTGKPILESNPQLPVLFPNAMYEIHLTGGRYNVRGITFPGSPGILIGWNRQCAWGLTALGGDHADLFEERVDPADPTRYLYREESFPFTSHQESIAVKGREPISIEVRETIHGPVVNPLLEGVKEGEVFALKHTLLASEHSSLEGQLTMMRATDWTSFREGMRNYAAPAAHLIFAGDDGTIAYQTLVSTPKRYGVQSLPRKGWTGEDEWEMVPFEELPSMVNPASHTIFTANHLPVGSWYPYIVTTSLGEGPRSWRLRELLAGDRKFSVNDFHQMVHLDPVNPGTRDFVTLAVRVAREDGKVPPAHEEAVKLLEEWDGQLTTDSPAYPLGRSVLDVVIREMRRDFPNRDQYGGGWNGINGLLKDLASRSRESGRTPSDPAVRRWLIDSLLTAIGNEKALGQHLPPISHPMPYQNNVGQWGSLASQHDLTSPPLICPVTESIWSQAGEAYVQIVDLADVDRSLALMPPGLSEDPANPHATSQVPLWVAGQMRPAPLSRSAVLAHKQSEQRLTWERPSAPGTADHR